MCTLVLGFDPDAPMAALIIGVRDEYLDRAWVGPARHWPQYPELLGGRDLLAGGTWLAVHSAAPRAASVLNGRGKPTAEQTRLSRGELPLRLAAHCTEPRDLDLNQLVDIERYDPCHLVLVSPDSARLWSWDGSTLTDQVLRPGLHLVVNSGLEGADHEPDGLGTEQMLARIEHFRPLLAAADRPRAASGPVADAWGGWLALANGGGLDPDDARALVVRGDHDGRPWGTSSVSLVAVGRDRVRYDFRAVQAQGEGGGWTTVLDGDAGKGFAE